MAEKIALDLLINTADSAKTVGEIKQSIKDIKNEMLAVGENSSEFKKLANAAAQAKDKLEDTQDAINALDPGKLGSAFSTLGSKIAGGFQAAQGAMVLFGQSGEDVQKTLLQVQAATAFAQGIQSVQDLGKAFKAFFVILRANPLGLAITAVTALVAGFAALSTQIDKANSSIDEMTESLEAQKKASELSVASIDLEIIALGGLAANEEKIIELRRQKFKEQIKIAEAEAAIAAKTIEEAATTQSFLEKTLSFFGQSSLAFSVNLDRIDKAGEKSKEAIENQKKLLAEFSAFENEQIQASIDKNKTISTQKSDEEQKARDEATAKRMLEFELDQENKRLQQEIIDSRNLEIKSKEQLDREEKLIAIDENAQAQTEIYRKQYQDEIDFATAKAAALVSIEQDSFSILSSLGTLLLNDGKKQEKFQKTLALTQIGIDTAKAISSAVAAAQANALNGATFGAAGIAQFATTLATILANMAKAKQLLNSSSGAAPSLGGGSPGGGVVSAPAVQLNPVSNTNTQLNPSNQDNGLQGFKVFVTETDITKTQQNINTINNQATVE